MNLRRCLHVEISSLRLFRVAMCGFVIKKNFSVVHRLQRFVRFVYGFALARIFHVTVKSLLSSFSFHRCLLSSVSFRLFSCLNDIWWLLYLALNWVAVRHRPPRFRYPLDNGSVSMLFFSRISSQPTRLKNAAA